MLTEPDNYLHSVINEWLQSSAVARHFQIMEVPFISCQLLMTGAR